MMASLGRSSQKYGLIVVLVLLSSDDTNLVRLHTSSKEKRTFFGVNLFLCQNLFRVREGLLNQLV